MSAMYKVLEAAIATADEETRGAVFHLVNLAYHGEELTPPEWLRLRKSLEEPEAKKSRKGQSRASRDREG